jgi:hypothetical protein
METIKTSKLDEADLEARHKTPTSPHILATTPELLSAAKIVKYR